MKILWFPLLQFDIAKLHITTWREMCRELEDNLGCTVRIAIAGKPINNIFNRPHISIFTIRKKFLRISTFWIFGYIKFIYHYLRFRPGVVILDIFSFWFSMPWFFFPGRKALFIVDNRTPHYAGLGLRDKIMEFYTKLCFWYTRFFLGGMTVISEFYKQEVCKNFKFKPSRVGIWSSGVDLDKFVCEKYRDLSRPDFLKDKFVIIQHGKMSEDRGIIETVKAMAYVKAQDICMVFLGEPAAGSKLKERLLNLIESLNLAKRVYMLPPVAHVEIPKYISFADCAVMAYPNIEYWNNNNPIKLLEYLAMGKLVICTDMWTFRDVMSDKKCAYYIKDNSPKSIAGAIEYCYRNRAFLGQWGRDGIEVVSKRFTWRKQAENLVNFIKHLQKDRIGERL
ncbi:MAG: glycosyltransferase family 4 protein [Candidatus Omnitrophica bacterium]|nr:glycosyltransferase family 4 protein [Candidatus Omnitrophota bacterium]